MPRRLASTLASALALSLLAAWAPARAQLPEPVAAVLRSTTMPENALSVLVLRGDRTVLSHLADRPMQPASTMKLVTTLIALEKLGPVFRGRTELRTTGELQGDTLKGDLYLRGGADMDLSTETLATILRALRNQGVRSIDGRLVLDRELFNPARGDLGQPPFDEYPEAYYNVVPDALLVNKNMLQLDIRSTGADKRINVAMQPALEGVTVATDMKLVDADCARWEDGWKPPEALPQADGGIQVMLHGTFPKNCAASYAINAIDRQEYLDRLLRLNWTQLGGKIAGATVAGTTPPEARLLAEHVSRPLPELVRDTNKPSDNALARTIFLSLGALEADPLLGSRPQAVSAANTFSRADAAIRGWMREHGIDDTGLVLDNGSGLSRIERITPLQMAGVLQAGLRSNWSPEFQASMPIVAVDGTMRRRLHDSPAAGRARMKTGTLNNVVALAGYVQDAHGQQCVLVAMINSNLAGNGRGRAVLDALVDWVARLDGDMPAHAWAGRVDGKAVHPTQNPPGPPPAAPPAG